IRELEKGRVSLLWHLLRGAVVDPRRNGKTFIREPVSEIDIARAVEVESLSDFPSRKSCSGKDRHARGMLIHRIVAVAFGRIKRNRRRRAKRKRTDGQKDGQEHELDVLFHREWEAEAAIES